ncbi:hypothetical protein GH714_019623 [Hevea brasiliensis]|uniref:Retrovirus-related Pol polyprotein from transposon TNT 1-94-like beta-barrel domain-containing protein n=1 Tax=Hevea brasiliensis TaxID=3981 RepID=A0A6A6LAU0_HEVBR|nr:hypothetical protein GH714_019623 [Hevea brasiliensis]
MKDLLFVKSLHLPVFATQKLKSKSNEDYEFEHEQVCGYIRQFIDDNSYNHISNERVGVGDVCLDTGNGMKLMLKDVRHALDVRLNLISARRLDDEGYLNIMGESKWKLTKGTLVVA